MSDVARAQMDLEQIERELDAVRTAREHAMNRLDAAFSDIGWHRAPVVRSPGAQPLYGNAAFPDALLTGDQVLALVEQQRRVLA